MPTPEIPPGHVAVYDGTRYTIVRATPRTLSRLDFRSRFTFEERVAIELAAESDPAVRVLLRDFDAAGDIDPDDPRTVAGVDLLITKGRVAAERRDVILAPVEVSP
jgi:hypothetical protein